MLRLSQNTRKSGNWINIRCWFVPALLVLITLCQVSNPALAFAKQGESPSSNQPAGVEYLLDKTITWSDGSVERVQIGKDGFFRLNGEKKKLVGVFLGTQYMPTGTWGQFYLPDNMAIYEKELAYLQSIGVRLIHADLVYIKFVDWGLRTFAEEQKAYKNFLDLLYRHKMLVIPEICGRGNPEFGGLQVNDFPIYKYGDSMGQWAARWIDIVSKYGNVVGIIAENELDLKEHPSDHPDIPDFNDQTYTAKDVAAYMEYLISILRTKYDGPILHKLAGTWLIEPEIKKAALNATDIGGFDCYALSEEEMDSSLAKLQEWLHSSGYPVTGWWAMELNAGWAPVMLDNLDTKLIESIFNHGASIAVLFPSNWSTEPTWQLFSNDGKPVPKLIEIARDFDRLQAPVGSAVSIAANLK